MILWDALPLVRAYTGMCLVHVTPVASLCATSTSTQCRTIVQGLLIYSEVASAADPTLSLVSGLRASVWILGLCLCGGCLLPNKCLTDKIQLQCQDTCLVTYV